MSRIQKRKIFHECTSPLFSVLDHQRNDILCSAFGEIGVGRNGYDGRVLLSLLNSHDTAENKRSHTGNSASKLWQRVVSDTDFNSSSFTDGCYCNGKNKVCVYMRIKNHSQLFHECHTKELQSGGKVCYNRVNLKRQPL